MAGRILMAGKRQRGVKASRIKLEHFMVAAGIKSQAELARKIADIEGLDTEPKDLVNRIFRQNKVEHHSLERVANALDVDAFKLYLTQDDQAIISENQKASANTQQSTHNDIESLVDVNAVSKHKGVLLPFIAVLVMLLIIAFFFLNDNESVDKAVPNSPSLNNVPANQSSLIFPSDQSLYPLAQYISEQPTTGKSGVYRFGLVPQALFDSFTVNQQTLAKYEVDNILLLELVESGRYLSLFIKRYSNENTETVGVINLSKNELAQSYAFINKRINQLLIQQAVNKTSNQLLMKVAVDITQARALSEQYYDTDNMLKANELLINLPKQNEESLAIQCLIKVHTGWHSNEKESFKQAKDLCERALVINSQHPLVRTINAFRLFKNGQLEAAAREYNAILTEYPNNIEGLLGQAQLSMQYYLKNPAERVESLNHAINLGQQAILHDPHYWKSYHLLSGFFYLAKQPKQALAVIKKLTELVANQMTLANGAMLSLCQAELEDAQAYSEKMLALEGNSYIAYETLFFINAYLNKPEQALADMEKAMTYFHDQGGLFMQWGQLADAHRWAGNVQQAINHYQTSLIEYQQDKTKNQTTSNDTIYSLYFQAAIHQLKSEEIPENIANQLVEFDVESMPSSHQLKVAVVYKWLGDTVMMNEIKQNLINTCPIYAHAPDLVVR